MKEKIKNIKTKREKKNKEINLKNKKGITLIALIITIIVLLILAAVSIATLTGQNGILTRANDTKTNTEIAEEKEKVELSTTGALAKDNGNKIIERYLEYELNSYIGQRNTDYKLEKEGENFIVTYIKNNRSYIIYPNGEVVEEKNREGIKVGDYINYMPDKNMEGYNANKLNQDLTGSGNNTDTIIQDKLNWQVLRIYKDGSIDIVGSPTSQTIYFNGANGYNNGVTIMNDICKTLYSKGNIKARSIKYEDIDEWLTDDGKKIKNNYSDYENGPTYGHTQTYMSQRYYPNLYSQEIGSKIDSNMNGLTEGIDQEKGNSSGLNISDEGKENGYSQANLSLTATQTFWRIDINTDNLGEGYNALKTDKTYWVASRFVKNNLDYVRFGLRNVGNGIFSGYNLFHSGNPGNSGYNYALRPVITLEPNVEIIVSNDATNISKPHTISKY